MTLFDKKYKNYKKMKNLCNKIIAQAKISLFNILKIKN
jgi:hypothetical protein